MTSKLSIQNTWLPKKANCILLIWFVVILQLLSLQVSGQPASNHESIFLRPQTFPFTPTEFYVAGVTDERPNKSYVAQLLNLQADTSKAATFRYLDLYGGAYKAINNFIRKGLARNTKLRPVIIRLKECTITESALADGRVEGNVAVSMSFDLKREYDTLQLVVYNGGAKYNRPMRGFTAVEQALRQSLVSAVTYLNTWMNAQALTNELLATGLKVSFTDYLTNTDNDTVFYSLDRPLTWDDFREKPRVSRYAASVFPSFAYEGQSTVVKGIIHVNLLMKVFVLKNSSWVKESARDAYGLNHEQRHFDIVKIVTERFKQKVVPDSLTVEDYNSIIQYQYIESFREMNRMQEQYDGETGHGLNRDQQERWNGYIDEELRKFGVKK